MTYYGTYRKRVSIQQDTRCSCNRGDAYVTYKISVEINELTIESIPFCTNISYERPG